MKTNERKRTPKTGVIMKDLEHFKNLGQILNKTQQKKILGGYGGDFSNCLYCYTSGDCDYSSCWVRSNNEEDAYDACHKIYPHCTVFQAKYDMCNGCN